LQWTQQNAGGVPYIGAPFTTSKGYLPDVFSWAAGAELALGRRSTLIADILGNQIGWIHGIQNTVTQSESSNQEQTVISPYTQQPATATGLVSAGRVSFGQYSGSFGYKARLPLNLVASANFLVRFDNNGLVGRFTPLFGLGYSF
jgi:hypothetical protein